MTDWSELKRLAEAATPGPWRVNGQQSLRGDRGEYIGRTNWNRGAENAAFVAAANPSAILALIAENEDQARRIRFFELVHGGRASELVREIEHLRAEVRRLMISAGEPVAPLPEEFIGPMPENCNARLRRKLQERMKSETQGEEQLRADLSAEHRRAAVLEQNCADLAAELERVRAEGERFAWLCTHAVGHPLVGLYGDELAAEIDAEMGKGGRADE